MKDILTIIFRLTVTCLVAGLIMGGGFILTNKAKQDNEHKNEQRVMLNLLGYSKSNPAPQAVQLHEMVRAILDIGDRQIRVKMPEAKPIAGWTGNP